MSMKKPRPTAFWAEYEKVTIAYEDGLERPITILPDFLPDPQYSIDDARTLAANIIAACDAYEEYVKGVEE